MNWKLAIAFTFVLSQSAFASSEAFQKVWNDSSGKHVLIIDKKLDSKDGGMTLLVKQVTGYSNDWTLKDFVRNCGEDIKLDIAPDYVKRAFKNNVFPYPGSQLVNEIKPLELLSVLQRME
ncbi:hypothetical protein ACYCJF_08665, partial [Klebsiella pneumoniae]